MEKLKIDHSNEYLHLALGISNERAEELGRTIGHFVRTAKEKGFVEDVEIDGEPGQTVHGNLILEALINEIAQTEQERLLLMMRFAETIERIRDYSQLGGDVASALRRLLEGSN